MQKEKRFFFYGTKKVQLIGQLLYKNITYLDDDKNIERVEET